MTEFAPSVGAATATTSESGVAIIIGLMVAVTIVAAAVRFVHVPYTVALVLTGLALAVAPQTPSIALSPGAILTIFLPVLLFHGAYNLDISDLRANLTPVALLAVPGVIVTAALVGAALHLAVGLAWGPALLFGAIVSATDPVAVLAIFGAIGAPRRLATIVNAESLFNDGTALVIFTTVLGVISAGSFDAAATAEGFVVQVAGSLALGAAVGIVAGTVLHRIDDALLETTITLILAYGGYLLATRFALSGALETVTAGLMLGARGTRVMSPTTRLQAGATWEFLDFLANSLLFLLVGLELRPVGQTTIHTLGGALGPGLLWPLAVAIVAVIVSRAIIALAVSLALKRAGHPWPRGWRTVLTWAGLRGAVALAAGLSLPDYVPQRGLILALTFGVTLFTLLAQGLTIRLVMERLGLVSEEASRHELEIARGRLRAVDAAVRELAALRQAHGLDDGLASKLEEEYGERRRELSQRVAEMLRRDSRDTLEREEEIQALRRLLRVQRDAIHASYARGLLSGTAERELEAELDRDLAQLEPAAEDE